MIPHILHLYWGGQSLSWLRYCTIVTFHKLNPDWKIKLWFPISAHKGNTWSTNEQRTTYEGQDYLDKLSDICERITFDMTTIGYSNEIPEVHKSDILRNHVLIQEGGIWSDMDIVYFKPIPESLLEKDFICWNQGDFSIGFIGAQQGSPLYQMFFNMQRQSKGSDYQIYGNLLYFRLNYPQLKQQYNFYNISMDLVYYHNCDNIAKIYMDSPISENSIGIHFYAGSEITRTWENMLNENNYKEYNNLICNKLKEVL